MATACIAQTTLQVHGIPKPIIARFDQAHASSDGGALLLKAVDERLGLTWRLAGTIRDRRQPGKVAHPLRDLLRQRVAGLRVKHDGTYNSGGYVRQGVTPTGDPRSSPGTLHPIVSIHPDTGRPGLYLGRRRNAYIEGLSLDESESLDRRVRLLQPGVESHATPGKISRRRGVRPLSAPGAASPSSGLPCRPRRRSR